MVTFVVLSYFTYREYTFLREQFGYRKNSPIKGIVLCSSVFALSFLFRSAINIWIAVDSQHIVNLQCKANLYNKGMWPFLVFCLQFFGETVPLSILFYIQDRNSRPRESTKLSPKPTLSQPAKDDGGSFEEKKTKDSTQYMLNQTAQDNSNNGPDDNIRDTFLRVEPEHNCSIDSEE